jgi:hypothetical protein
MINNDFQESFISFYLFFCDNIKSNNIKDYLFGLPYHTFSPRTHFGIRSKDDSKNYWKPLVLKNLLFMFNS